MSKAAVKTGIGSTVVVAVEQLFPKNQRGIEDELSYRILPSVMKAYVNLMRIKSIRNRIIQLIEENTPGFWACIICRKRYIDQKLNDSISQMDAVINLGAGFDTGAFRQTSISDKQIFEIDQPEIIQKKKLQLSKIFNSIPPYLKLVSMDFDREDISSKLKSHGYSSNMKTFYIMEGVTQYLTEDGIKAVFNFLSEASSGSRLVFTYVRKDFIDGRAMYNWENGYIKFVLKEKFWLFGMDPEGWPDFLRQYGWQIIEDVSYADLHERYIKPTGRELDSTLVERIVHAKKQ